MKARPIICIVEGQGERGAVPALVNRMLKHLRRDRRFHADAERVLCTKDGSRIVEPHNHERKLGVEFFVGLAARDKPAGILVVVDAENRCASAPPSPAPPLGPSLRARAAPVAGSIPLAVVVADRMFEAWFLADAQSLVARAHLRSANSMPKLRVPSQTHLGPKSVMTNLLGTTYSETGHQPALAEVLSLPLRPGLKRRAPSLYKLFREVDALSRQA